MAGYAKARLCQLTLPLPRHWPASTASVAARLLSGAGVDHAVCFGPGAAQVRPGDLHCSTVHASLQLLLPVVLSMCFKVLYKVN